MTMHVVLGDGLMKPKELHASLDELWQKATDEDTDFWFLVQGKSDPTSTDTSMVKWLDKQDVFYNILTDDIDSVDGLYANAQEKAAAKNLGTHLKKLIAKEIKEGEDIVILGLFVSDDSDAEEDRWLNDVLQMLSEEGHLVLALNDGMVEVSFEDEDEEPEPEPEPERKPRKKAASKKTAAKRKAEPEPEPEPEPAEDEDPDDESDAGYSRDELEDMELADLKKIAKARGIELPPRTRATTYVEEILASDDPGEKVSEVEVHEADPVDFDIEDIVERVIARLVERLS